MVDTIPAECFQVIHGSDGQNLPVFSLLLKRTYDIQTGGRLSRAASISRFRNIDEYYDSGDPDWATVKFEADLVAFKPAVDLVVVGKAYAPNGRPVQTMDISVEVAGRKKIIRLFGDRKCRWNPGQPPFFTDPADFQAMEVRYERAFGGTDKSSDPLIPFTYPRNHMGCGLVLKNVRERVEGLALPNLEDPEDLLTPERIILDDPYRWNSLPLPQGLGWVQRSWYPRSSFAGIMPPFLDPDEVMREELLGLVPARQVALARQFRLPSFDARFNNGASPGLLFPHLTGGEKISLQGLTLSGRLDFVLPGEQPKLMLDIGIGENELEPVLQTVCIRPEDMQVDLVWRGAHPYPGLDWLPEMKRLQAEVA